MLFIFICAAVFAQNSSWMIPRIVYVGDPATLITPLPESREIADFILLPHDENFPRDSNIDFHRIVLERRLSGSRLLIEFTAFLPGVLELPDIVIGGEIFSGLSITINSVIREGGELSPPAAALAMPGTALMIYGSIAILVMLLLLTIWFFMHGRRHLEKLILKLKQWKNFASIKRIEKRLYASLTKGADKRDILNKLSDEFKIFLGFFTGQNCRAMTSFEFKKMPPELFAFNGQNADNFGPLFLSGFFHRCDDFRFSGNAVNDKDIFVLLDDLRLFVAALEKTGKENKKHAEGKAA